MLAVAALPSIGSERFRANFQKRRWENFIHGKRYAVMTVGFWHDEALDPIAATEPRELAHLLIDPMRFGTVP